MPRTGLTQKAPPNTNMIIAKTLVPQLRAAVPAGQTILMTAVLAANDKGIVTGAWTTPPQAPDLAELEALVASKGIRVSAIEAPGQVP